MKRSVLAALAGTAVCGLVTAGITGPASAAEDPYPESEGWVQLDDHVTIPAGYACQAEIVEDLTAHVRTLTVSERQTFDDWGEDSRDTFTNPANGKKVTVDISGDALILLSKSGKTARLTNLGGGVFYGRGIRGLVYGDGVQKLKVTQADTRDFGLRLRIVNGTRRQLCRELGTTAVPGRTLPEPASTTAATKALSTARR